MTELEGKIKAYEEGIRLLTELRSEEARAEELRNALNEPNADIKQVRNEIKDLKKKIRECNKNLRALGLEGNVKLVDDLTKRLNQLRREQARANMQARAKLFGQKLGDLKRDLDERRKKYAEEHKGEILEKAKSIVERIRSGARELGKRSDGQRSDNENSKKKTDKVNLKALLLALTMVGATGGIAGKVMKAPQNMSQNNAIVEELEENESRLQEKHYVVNHQAVYKAHNVDNEYGFINFRSQPTIGSDVITKLNAGQAVFIKDTPVVDIQNENSANNWKVAMYYDANTGTYVDGYVDANLLSGEPEDEAAVIIKDEDVQEVFQDDEILESDEYFEVNRFEVSAPFLNFRANPEITEENVISKLEEGNTILMYGDNNKSEVETQESTEVQSADMSHDWKKAMYHNSNHGIYVGGYLDAQYVAETEQVQEEKQNEDKLVEEATEANSSEPAVAPTEEQNNEAQVDISASVEDENQTATPKTSGDSVSVDSYNESDIEVFKKYPGYYEYISKLKAEHPNWIFEIMETGLDYQECINKHFDQRAVAVPLDDNWSSEWFNINNGNYVFIDTPNWYAASKECIAAMMDPRNFLNEVELFQFETIGTADGITVENVERAFKDVPWATADKFTYTTTTGETVTMDKSFAQLLYDTCIKYNFNPVYAASAIAAEQGGVEFPESLTGKGNVSGYEGYYNYGNIMAYAYAYPGVVGAGECGLIKAKEAGWDSPEAAIEGYINFEIEKFIKTGRDCEYLKKFDINGDGSNVYMTALTGPYNQAITSHNGADLDIIHKFKIPVYENMPENLCPLPAEPGMPMNYFNGGIADRTLENVDDNNVVAYAQVNPIIQNNEGEVIKVLSENKKDKEEQDLSEDMLMKVKDAVDSYEMDR